MLGVGFMRTPVLAATVAIFGLIILVVACGTETFGSAAAPDAGGDAAAPAADEASTTDAQADSAATLPTPCGDVRAGPAMVRVPGEAGAGAYCIDSTEVSQGDYAVFLAVVGVDKKLDDLPPKCAAKTTSHLPGNGQDCQFNPYQPDDAGKMPVGCVDWCDAYAFCRWADKHLCGAVGGGTSSDRQRTDPNKDEWYRACTNGSAARAYPYGTMFDANACNAGNKGDLTTVPAKTTCEGGVPGLFDMSGNASEWSDSCSPGGCAERGGDFGDTEALDVACTAAVTEPPLTRRFQLGFRCCK